MLFDTDVIIWALRGNRDAMKELEHSDSLTISIITYMELLRGARSKFHASEIHRVISKYDFRVLPLGENIGRRALTYIEEYGLRSGMDVPDALIAATAAENDMELCTGNAKDYREIKELKIRAFKAV